MCRSPRSRTSRGAPVAVWLPALLLAACGENGKRYPAQGVALERQARLLLNVADGGDGEVQVCLALRRSVEAGAWIGERVQTWWRLGEGQQFSVNGRRMQVADGEHVAAFWPQPYCARVAAANDYALEWRDATRRHVANDILAALPAPALRLHAQRDGHGLLRWQPDARHPARAHLGIPAAEPPVPDDVAHFRYAGSPLAGAGPVADGKGESALRIHPQTRALHVRFLRERDERSALLGFAATEISLRQDVSEWLDVPAATPIH